MRLRTIMTIVFCISAFAPLAIFWLWPQSQVLKNEIQDARDSHLVIAQNMTISLDRYYDDIVNTLEYMIANSSNISNLRSSNKLLENLEIVSVCAVNINNGKLISGINTSKATCPKNISEDQLNWMKQEIGDIENQVVMSGVKPTKSNGNVLTALYKNKNIIHVASISTEYFKAIGSALKFGSKGYVVILDKNGMILSHPNKEWENNSNNLSNLSPIKKALTNDSGVDTYYSPVMKQDMIAGYANTKKAGWMVMLPQPISEIRERASSEKQTALTVMAIGFLIAIILAYYASKILTYPIEQMLLSMHRIGNGELWAHEKMQESRFQPKEFDDARSSIKTMAEKLQENIDTISRHAYLDGVTGLPNRECFRVLAQEEIDKLSLSGNSGALLFLDLDGFKQVNDVYGHRAGDDLLLAFSQKLHEYCGVFMKRYARGVDNALTILPARLGGDEFVVFLGNISGPETTSEFANQLFTKVFGEFNLHNGIKLDISGSVGGAVFPTQAADFDELLRLADIAMYEAKNTGKGRYCLHRDVEEYFENISTESRFETA